MRSYSQKLTSAKQYGGFSLCCVRITLQKRYTDGELGLEHINKEFGKARGPLDSYSCDCLMFCDSLFSLLACYAIVGHLQNYYSVYGGGERWDIHDSLGHEPPHPDDGLLLEHAT